LNLHFRPRAALALLALSILGGAGTASPQVVFDDTFGPSGTAPTRILGGETDYVIDPSRGLIVTGGGRSNLFHSFSQFDVPLDESATFLMTDSIDTLIARVTSGSASRIDGRIRGELTCALPPCAGAARADLFFINPAGVLFGESASLELPGSFYVTSADSLRFTDGLSFSSSDPAPTVTAAAPEAFGFLAGPSGDIEFDRPLPVRVATGETLSAIGGNVAVRRTGTLLARGGQIELAAVGEGATEVPVDLAQWATRDSDASTLGEVFVGEQVSIETLDFGDPDGDQGQIVIRGGRFVSETSFLFAGGDGSGASAVDVEVAGEIEIHDSSVFAFGSGTGTTGGIRLSGAHIEVTGALSDGVVVQTFGSGDAGPIVVDADQLLIDAGSSIVSETIGAGRGAPILVTADSVEVGAASRIRSRTTGTGFANNDAGEIQITASELLLRDGGQISGTTEGSGRAADVRILGADTVRIEGELAGFPSGVFATSGLALGTPATGDGGLVRIETADLLMTGGGQISARTFGTGAAGRIEVSATGRVLLEGAGIGEPTLISTRGFLGEGGSIEIAADVLDLQNGGRIQSTADGFGNAGDILITAREISMGGTTTNGFTSRIAAETLLDGNLGVGGSAGRIELDVSENLILGDGANISARSIGRGATNDITIDAGQSIRLDSDASISSRATFTTAAVAAGDVLLTAGGTVELRDGSAITAQADGLGDAGNIEVRAASIDLDNSSLTTNAATALGGNILIDSARNVVLFQSQATTDVGGGAGQGGDIFINAETAVINTSIVTANARGSADAGNVQITTTDGLLESTNSRIEASAELGISGSVVVQGPNSEISGELSQLPVTFLDAASQLEEACLARDAPAGSFEVRAIPALQRAPDELFDPFRTRAEEGHEACEAPLP